MHGRFISLLVVALAMVPATAEAASAPAASTITACGGDHFAVAGKVTVSGKAKQKARGAVLQMRFQAIGLFGFPIATDWRTVGKKTRASGQQDFNGLDANSWIGVLSWRFKKGSRTVLSGDARSQPVAIGGKKGRANCVLFEGVKPLDKNPPTLYVQPVDDAWHRGPAGIQVVAQDDFSGVKSVVYSL